jgi:hypothetical protein
MACLSEAKRSLPQLNYDEIHIRQLIACGRRLLENLRGCIWACAPATSNCPTNAGISYLWEGATNMNRDKSDAGDLTLRQAIVLLPNNDFLGLGPACPPSHVNSWRPDHGAFPAFKTDSPKRFTNIWHQQSSGLPRPLLTKDYEGE